MKNYKQTGSHYTWPTQLATFSLLLELLCVSTRCLRSKITERRETPVYERGPLFMIFHYRGLACSLIIKTAHVCSNQRHSCMYHDKCHPCLYAECRPAKYQHILSKTGFMGHSCGGVGMWNIRGHSLCVGENFIWAWYANERWNYCWRQRGTSKAWGTYYQANQVKQCFMCSRTMHELSNTSETQAQIKCLSSMFMTVNLYWTWNEVHFVYNLIVLLLPLQVKWM